MLIDNQQTSEPVQAEALGSTTWYVKVLLQYIQKHKTIYTYINPYWKTTKEQRVNYLQGVTVITGADITFTQ